MEREILDVFPHGILIFDGFLSLIFPKETLFITSPWMARRLAA